MNSTLADHVTATDAALALLTMLRDQYGPLLLSHRGACDETGVTVCAALGDAWIGSASVYLGNIERAPVYIDYEHFALYRDNRLVVDTVAGAGAAGSLDNEAGQHFVLRVSIK